MNNIPNLKYKTTLCTSWLEGVKCIKNDGCYFAHGQQELRTIQQNRLAISERNRNATSYARPDNFKTVFCKFYGKGQCRLGDACTFAHQRREKAKRDTNTYPQNTIDYQQYYAYYQLTNWMAQYSSLFPLPSAHNFYVAEDYLDEGAKEETVTLDSHSPALSKSSNESEQVEKQITASHEEDY